MRYRIYGTFFDSKTKEEIRYFLQTNHNEKPNRTLLSSKFTWVSVLSQPTAFESIEIALAWFKMLSTKNECWHKLSIEKVAI